MVIIAVGTVISTVVYIMIYLKQSYNLPKSIVNMQSMLILSLFIQATVHAVLIAAPIIVFVYARFAVLTNLGLTMVVCLTHHGFVSTCAMILFTKPVRDKLFCMKLLIGHNLMESRDCTLSAPIIYKTVMQVSHSISYPTYLAVLWILIRERSKPFQKYKYYLIVHILINMASETYVSFLMLPMTYLPHMAFRNTGILSRFGFSGILQWYFLATMVMLTGGSICEMFYYRFRVSIFDFRDHKMSKFLLSSFWSYRLLTVGHAVFASCTIGRSIELQETARVQLWLSYPSLPPEITCYSVVFAIPQWINLTVMLIYFLMTLLAVSSVICSVIYMKIYLKNGYTLSAATVRMQSMLILSLIVQAVVHAVLIAGPIIVFIYARFSVLTIDNLGLAAVVCVTYHGFFSTCAMIYFTKPVREALFCRCCSKGRRSVKSVMSVQPSVSAQGSIGKDQKL
ncbi:unnamed protein product [Caenorhabditis sp. 36 PRJEB53466]|nr:unnamed protein product [Caenorhabditis sp. 36 PRJEB53466]